MATIGNLAIKLTANAAGLIQGLEKAGRSLALTVARALGLGAVIDALGGSWTNLLRNVVTYTTGALAAAAETSRLARSIGSSVDGLVGMQRAMRELGQDGSQAAEGLAVLRSRIAGFGGEGQYAADVLKRLGLNQAELVKLSTDEAFKRIADKIAALPTPAEKAAAAFALFGDKAAAMLPLLDAGSKGMASAAERARALGLSFSQVDAAKIEQANTQLKLVSDIFSGIATQVAVQVAPYLTAFLEQLGNLGKGGMSVGQIVATAFRWVATSVAFAIDAVAKLGATIIGGVGLAIVTIIYLVARAMEWLQQKLTSGLQEAVRKAAAAKGIILELADSPATKIRKKAEEIGGHLAEALKRTWTDPGAIGAVNKFFDNVEAQAERNRRALEELSKKAAGGAVPKLSLLKPLFQQAAQVFQDAKTPLQKFDDGMTKLNALVSVGAIGWETYARSAGKAVLELDRAHQLSEVKLPSGLRREDSASLSAINKAEALENTRFRESPEQRVARILEQSLEIERQQLEYSRRIAEALTARRVAEVRL